MISKGSKYANNLLESSGFEFLNADDLEDLIWSRGCIIREDSLSNSDGRIVIGKDKALITINSNIEYLGKKRFTLAHELGHFEMHKNIEIHGDNELTFDFGWFKNGNQEKEANDFATELLMPASIFTKECSNNRFGPELIRKLSTKFETSITSVVFRLFQLELFPFCIFYSKDNIVRYWKRPSSYPYFINDRTRLKPPSDSVATEYFDKNKIYAKEQSQQQIWKSTWFDVRDWENENDYKFYEYCIITPKYNTVISVVWEE